MKGDYIGYLLLLPYFCLVFLFIIYPAIRTIITSLYFFNLKVPSSARFVGAENYLMLLTDSTFWASVRITFIFMIFCVTLSITLGLGFALLLNESFKGVNLLRLFIVLPWAIPPMVNGFLWRWLLDGHHGALNGLLYQLGVIPDYYSWLTDPFWAIFFTALAQAWTTIPLITLILLSGMKNIPIEIIESSKVDGAGAFQRFRYITLPMISPTLAISLAAATVFSFLAFDSIYIMTGIDPRTRILNIYNYEVAFKYLDIGSGSALSLIILVMGICIAFYYVKSIWKTR